MKPREWEIKKMKNNNKKKIERKPAKASPKKTVSQELVIRVQPQEVIPTEQDFLEPIHEGKKYSVEKTPFTIRQILSLVAPTPRKFIYNRKGKGGKSFNYVDIHYIIKKLNYTFGFLWDFDVIAQGRDGEFIWVQGKLTGKLTNGTTISKTQFGRAEVKYLRDKPHKPENMVDYGNDLKAASSDCLKKCASMFGIASDVYGKSEYQEETGKDLPVSSHPVNVMVNNKDAVPGPEGKAVILCQNCDGIMSQAEADFSQRLFKKKICRECQPKKK